MATAISTAKDDEPIRKEEDLKIAYRLTWFGTPFDFNTEVNNGRGPVDVKASMGARDTTVVELKLASNSQLEKNLRNQLEVYKEANRTQKGILSKTWGPGILRPLSRGGDGACVCWTIWI